MNEYGQINAYLASCVYNLGGEILTFDSYDFAECVLDSRVVTLNEVAVHKLYSEGGFACKRESAQVQEASDVLSQQYRRNGPRLMLSCAALEERAWLLAL